MNWYILQKIRHNPEAAIVAGLALSAQVFHAQHVFFEVGHTMSVIGALNSWLYAGAVEFAVFFFVLRGWGLVSWGFAIASIGVNVAYYTIAHADAYGWAFMFQRSMLSRTWFMWLLAIVLPVAVAAFSHAADDHDAPAVGIEVTPDSIALPGAQNDGQNGRFDRFEGIYTSAAKNATDGRFIAVEGEPANERAEGGPANERANERADDGLDDTDARIIAYLRENGPATRRSVADAVNMTSQAMERKRSGQRRGRLVKLENAGLVGRDDSGLWYLVDTKPFAPVGDGSIIVSPNGTSARPSVAVSSP